MPLDKNGKELKLGDFYMHGQWKKKLNKTTRKYEQVFNWNRHPWQVNYCPFCKGSGLDVNDSWDGHVTEKITTPKG